ncbi:MAG: HAMP domain-containing sensor histidine kinase [Oscillospiraceae bacterium]|nr:HAMP domain-containing sensor histidine kinase [Oscillospiraceae bacterium]MDD6146389.1 HAMP domain-containing sensor histidine kinase [Oscillospiraceae bacterium]
MGQSRKTNLILILIFMGVIVAFAYSYNASVTTAVADAAYNDMEILQNYNNEIISKLIKEDSVAQWSDIVEQYEDVVIVIENSSNQVVTKSIGKTWSTLDVKVQTPFEFGGEAYLIKSSVYFLRDYVTDIRVMVKFIFMEFLIGLSALLLLIFTIYTIMLRPFKGLYRAIEEYDKTGKLKDVVIKGYAGEVYGRFVSMTKNLERQQQNQRRIIASISHDIKTPLTSIMGYTERLKKDSISPERKKKYIDTVYDKSLEIQELVDEFDEYLSLNIAQKLRKTSITTSQLRDFIIRDYADELENAGVKLTVRNEAGSAVFMADKQKLNRVFGNIFANSLKHFKGNIRLIDVDMHCDKEKVYFDISDSGEGVDPEKLELIFEPLYTSDEGRKVAGLGLSICREIIESHGGKIYARTSQYGGLTVCIELEKAEKGTLKG